MGDYAIQAATATHDQLAQLYPELPDAELWGMVGVTPMIGINDDSTEIFTTEDAEATNRASRSRKGSDGWRCGRSTGTPPARRRPRSTSNTCSGVSDPRWAFSSAFGRFGSLTAELVPPVAFAGDVLARRLAEVGRAHDEDLESLRPGLVASPGAGRDAHRVPFPSSTISSSSFIRPLPCRTTYTSSCVLCV